MYLQRSEQRPIRAKRTVLQSRVKQTPPKIQFYLLGGVFSPVYNMHTLLYIMYTMLVSGIY